MTDSSSLHADQLNYRRRRTLLWSFAVVLLTGIAGYLRMEEGPEGPWMVAILFAVAASFGAAQDLSRSRARITACGAMIAVFAFGTHLGWSTARLRHGYVAGYGFATAWILAGLLAIVGAGLTVPQSTRRVGALWVAAGVSLLSAFYLVVSVAMATNQTRWHELDRQVPFGPDVPHSLVVVFVKGVSEQQIEKYAGEYLRRASGTGHGLVPGVCSYLRVLDTQARHGHWSVALTYCADTSADQRVAIKAKLAESKLVFGVYENVAPNQLLLPP